MPIQIDPTTGLPLLPPKHYFYVHRRDGDGDYKVTIRYTRWFAGPIPLHIRTREYVYQTLNASNLLEATKELMGKERVKKYLARREIRDEHLRGAYKSGKRSLTGIITREMKD